VHSVATTLAALWGDELWNQAKSDADAENLSVYVKHGRPHQRRAETAVLAAVSDRLERDFGPGVCRGARSIAASA